MKTVDIFQNYNCKKGRHSNCPGASRGEKVIFICSCPCHKEKERAEEKINQIRYRRDSGV